MNVKETAEKIINMEIRGAGKIARAAAEGLKDFLISSEINEPIELMDQLKQASEILHKTRPTAVSLENALNAVLTAASGSTIEEIKGMGIAAADKFIAHSLQAVDKISDIVSEKIQDNQSILTHCNSSVVVRSIIKAKDQGKSIRVFATETRPWGQGYITTQQLADAGVDITLIVDSAANYFMPEIDLVLFGADTITLDGTVINKIGTSQIALAAKDRQKLVWVCAESYKFSNNVEIGNAVTIEERDHSEIVRKDKLKGVKLRNPVFDRTLPKDIDLIITEFGEIEPLNTNEIKDIIQRLSSI
jgi:ribose 1,5-bisphosphate isomerase